MKRKPARRAAPPPDPQNQQAPAPTSSAPIPDPAVSPGANGGTTGQAPAYLKGIQPQSVDQMLAQASPEQIETLRHENFAIWARFSGLEIDSREPFGFDDRRYLLPMYLDHSKEIVWIKAAQMGATVYMLLRLIWFCLHHKVKCGLYFPTGDGVKALSKDRLKPLLHSSEELRTSVKDDTDAMNIKQINNIHGGLSSLYMLYLGGTASKDSVPLDVVAFDEVRLVNPQSDIDQALERLSASKFKYKMFMSTAGYPNLDIHERFLMGTQLTWHVKCNCLDGFVPSDVFPDCVVDTGKEVYLRCPKCKYRIHDPQNGMYIPHNPGARFNSYHVSQLVSKRITVAEVWDHYLRTRNKKEFYNAKLGRPYIDEENMPVNDDVLTNCVNDDARWAYTPGGERKRWRNCAMGVDQHAGNVFIVIARRNEDGKKQIIHLEFVETANPNYWEAGKPVTPFKRVHELMKEFDIGMCLVDAMPNANEAQELARAFPNRVYITWFSEGAKDMVSWHDRIKHKEAVRKGSHQIKLKWQVTLSKYQSIDYALAEFVERNVETPHPDALLQVATNQVTGRFETEAICRERFWLHLKSVVRQKTIIDEQTGKFRMEWVYLGRDPHFLMAWNYCNIAIERLKRRPIIAM